MQIRPAQLSDAPALGRLMVDTWLTAHRDHIPVSAWEKRSQEWSYAESEHAWRRTLGEIDRGSRSDTQLFVAILTPGSASGLLTVDGVLAGLAMVIPARDYPDTAEISALYVAQNQQRRGVGRLLMQAVAAHLQETSRSRLHVGVLEGNQPARRFYEALGGQVVYQREFDEDGLLLPEVVYGWPDLGCLMDFAWNQFGQPVGLPVARAAEARSPASRLYEGRYVTLNPVNPAADGPDLYAGVLGADQIWTYMGYGPFADLAAMQRWLESCQPSQDPLFLTVRDISQARAVGVVSFLNIAAANRCLELGHIWYVPTAQRTRINTEAIYLMLCETFEGLGYRRAEWKCDRLNSPSRAAAERLGFRFEGIFRQHRVVRDRNRDTAWFALLDTEWPAVKANMEHWLYEDDSVSLRQLNLGDR